MPEYLNDLAACIRYGWPLLAAVAALAGLAMWLDSKAPVEDD